MILNIYFGSLALSIIHILIPNHWMPIVIIGRAEGWKRSKFKKVAILAGTSHSLSTILIGVAVGLLGMKLTTISMNAMKLVGPSLFFIYGSLYLIAGIRDNLRKHSHRHIHLNKAVDQTGKSASTAIVISMFFTPCLEIETYFFNASIAGLAGIGIVGLIYFCVTVIGLLLMVNVGRKGLEFRGFQLFEKYERHILGIFLMSIAIISYLYFD